MCPLKAPRENPGIGPAHLCAWGLLAPAHLLSLTFAAHVIAKAKGLAVLSVIKAGFLVTARGGSGIVLARLPDGSKWCFFTWGGENPAHSLFCFHVNTFHREYGRPPTPQTCHPEGSLGCVLGIQQPRATSRHCSLPETLDEIWVDLALSCIHFVVLSWSKY